MPVYIKVFDVDDPFDQIYGPLGSNDVANVGLIDNDTVGDDNRGGSDPAASYYYRDTDENGEARLTLTMSMQPGNNYRAAASVIQDTMSQQRITQEMADALSVTTDGGGRLVPNGNFSGYQVPVVWSKMLTVWRKLHVEVDSMAAEPTTVADRSPDWDEFDAIQLLAGEATTVFTGIGLELAGGWRGGP